MPLFRPAPEWSHLSKPKPISLWRMIGGAMAFLAMVAGGFVIAHL